MTITLEIHLDKPHGAYVAGETVRGKVIMDVKRTQKIRALSLRFTGEAQLCWDDGDMKESDYWRARQSYFDSEYILVGTDKDEVEVQCGEHMFPFEYPLPDRLPCTFSGRFGRVRYSVKALVHRPWSFDSGVKAPITVVSISNSDALPMTKEPVQAERSVEPRSFLSRSGLISATLRLPQSRFVPGQAIPVEVSVDNKSESNVKFVICSFVQEVQWNAARPVLFGQERKKTKVTKEQLARLKLDEVPPGSPKTFNVDLIVPPVPPSSLDHCDIIDVEYVVKMEAAISGLNRDLKMKIPITIGPMPLTMDATKSLTSEPSETLPQYTVSNANAPPSYEECITKGITEAAAGRHDTMAALGYTSRYPVNSGFLGLKPPSTSLLPEKRTR